MTHPTGTAQARTLLHRFALAVLVAVAALTTAAVAVLVTAAPASAHVVPSTVIALDVHTEDITAQVSLPTTDLATASGLDLPQTGTLDPTTTAQVADYLQQHIAVTSGADTWTVTVGDITLTQTEQWGTGTFSALAAAATLTPTDRSDLRSFTLDVDTIVHQVVTADVYVLLTSDWAAGQIEQTRTLGTITTDTITGTIPTLDVDLDTASPWRGLTTMINLGVHHIADGTDHQLFLLTLLLPAPLLAAAGRWRGTTRPRQAARRIGVITLAFTLGHSLTLALGTFGLPVPQQPVEALIALSILTAAAHAARPLFPGREPLIAALFGLIHGMAFSTTLADLNLTGGQLALSLLGFNLGIELMQLAVVLAVLPPLIVLARTRAYPPLRLGAAATTALAATGWLIDRTGHPNPLATAADTLGTASPAIAAALWIAAAVTLLRRRTPSTAGNPLSV